MELLENGKYEKLKKLFQANIDRINLSLQD